MNIVFRLSVLGFGGTERVFLSLADYLSATHGWTVTFVVDRVCGQETEQVVRDKGYALVALNVARTWQSIWPFARWLARERPNVVVSAYTETNGAALLSRALRHIRVAIVVTEHAPLDEHWAGKPASRRLLLELTVRLIYRLADYVLCVSNGMAQGVRRRLNGRTVTYIHNPVRFASRTHNKAQARKALGMDPDARVLLAVGRVSRAKNYLMLLQAFSAIQRNDIHLYIVGGVYESDEKAKLDQLVKAQALADRVHFVGFTHDVNRYYEAADMLVLSSAWEGFGNVLVEALAFGLPIVSTRCNHGPAEILEDGRYGELVAVGDVEGMARAIVHVLEKKPFDPAAQVRRAEVFSEARIGKAYHDLICQVAGRYA